MLMLLSPSLHHESVCVPVMPRKRKMATSLVVPAEVDIKGAKKGKTDEEKPPVQQTQQLRDIGNIVMKSKAGLFSSNIFCKEVLDAVSEEFVQSRSTPRMGLQVPATKIPASPSRRTKSRAEAASHAIATSILLENSTYDEADVSLYDPSCSSNLSNEPVQHSKTTLQMLADLEKLKNARDNDSYVLSDDDSLDGLLCLDDLPEKILVMIQSDEKLFKYNMKMDETFESVFERLSREFAVKPSQLLLTLRESTVQVQDTPASLCMTTRDILGCIVKKFVSAVMPTKLNRRDLISLKFQCNNKRIHHTVEIGKGQPLLEALKVFAEKTSLDLCKMVVKFDGEKVDLEESPDDLGIESGDCIDVVIRS